MSANLESIYKDPRKCLRVDLVMNLSLFEMFYNKYLDLYEASNEDGFYLERASFFLDKKLAVEKELEFRDKNKNLVIKSS
jgi:hypothetical protein